MAQLLPVPRRTSKATTRHLQLHRTLLITMAQALPTLLLPRKQTCSTDTRELAAVGTVTIPAHTSLRLRPTHTLEASPTDLRSVTIVNQAKSAGHCHRALAGITKMTHWQQLLSCSLAPSRARRAMADRGLSYQSQWKRHPQYRTFRRST